MPCTDILDLHACMKAKLECLKKPPKLFSSNKKARFSALNLGYDCYCIAASTQEHCDRQNCS